MKLLFSSLLGQVLMRCLLDLEVRMATCQRCQKGEFNVTEAVADELDVKMRFWMILVTLPIYLQ